MPKAFLNYPADSGCPYNRILLPGRFCGEQFKEFGWEVDVGEGLPAGYDVYFLHGLLSPEAIVEMAKLRRKGAKFVWGVDDDWKTIPDWNPAKPDDRGLAVYDLAKMMADWIIVSTPHLASTFTDVRDKVLFAPNLVDLERFPTPNSIVEPSGRKAYDISFDLPIRVVWSGGATHKEDIDVLVEPIDRLLSKFDNSRVLVVFNGMAPPKKLMTRYLHRGVLHQPGVPFTSYQSVLNSIKPHIYLAPMAEVDFNLSKSNLRVIEGWSLLTPVVASDFGEYSCVKTGVDGTVVKTADDWYHALHRLVTDHNHRIQMGANGRDRVERDYAWQSTKARRPWMEAFATIFGTPVPLEKD